MKKNKNHKLQRNKNNKLQRNKNHKIQRDDNKTNFVQPTAQQRSHHAPNRQQALAHAEHGDRPAAELVEQQREHGGEGGVHPEPHQHPAANRQAEEVGGRRLHYEAGGVCLRCNLCLY